MVLFMFVIFTMIEFKFFNCNFCIDVVYEYILLCIPFVSRHACASLPRVLTHAHFSDKRNVADIHRQLSIMAETPDVDIVVEKGLEELEKEITCPVCHEHFLDPKILPCCHYYCKECVQKLVSRAGPNRPFACPECRHDTVLPQNDPNQLPTAFFVNRMKETYTKMAKAEGKVEALCEICSGAKAEAFCRQCAYFICSDCMKSHQKMKAVFPGHEVVTLYELKVGGACRLPLKEAPPMMCKEHEELLKIFCFDCDRLICRDCIVIDHAGHKYEFVKKSAAQCKQKLREGLLPLNEIHGGMSDAMEKIEVTKIEIQDQGTFVATTIKNSFAKLHQILNEREQALLSKASGLVQRKLESLSAQEKNLKLASAEIQSLGEFVEQNLQNATDEEVMSVHTQILSRLEEERQKHAQLDLEITEYANIDVTVDCEDGIAKTVQTGADVSLLPVELTAKVSEIKPAEVGIATTVTIHVYKNGKPHRREQIIEAQLKSLVDDSTIRMKGIQKENGKYKLTYCPTVRGHHTLSVSMNGQPVTGSPFEVFVKIHPTKLGQSVRVIRGVPQPWGIAISLENQLLVCEYKSNQVQVLSKMGDKVRTIGSGCGLLLPTGIARDNEGNIYVTDCGKSLFKFNKDGNLLKVIKANTSKLSGPGGVRVVGEYVYVCDRSNNRIAVFSRELESIRYFEGLKCPQDIQQDQRGDLYITDTNTHSIRLFSKEGKQTGSFGADNLREPRCICFDSANEHLYVIDSNGFGFSSVSVFTSDGKFVTSFSRCGAKEGKLNNPWGLAVDSDGFVYVCDLGNSRIQVF